MLLLLREVVAWLSGQCRPRALSAWAGAGPGALSSELQGAAWGPPGDLRRGGRCLGAGPALAAPQNALSTLGGSWSHGATRDQGKNSTSGSGNAQSLAALVWGAGRGPQAETRSLAGPHCLGPQETGVSPRQAQHPSPTVPLSPTGPPGFAHRTAFLPSRLRSRALCPRPPPLPHGAPQEAEQVESPSTWSTDQVESGVSWWPAESPAWPAPGHRGPRVPRLTHVLSLCPLQGEAGADGAPGFPGLPGREGAAGLQVSGHPGLLRLTAPK